MAKATVTLQAFMPKWEMLHLLGAAFFLTFFENNYKNTCMVVKNKLPLL